MLRWWLINESLYFMLSKSTYSISTLLLYQTQNASLLICNIFTMKFFVSPAVYLPVNKSYIVWNPTLFKTTFWNIYMTFVHRNNHKKHLLSKATLKNFISYKERSWTNSWFQLNIFLLATRARPQPLRFQGFRGSKVA